MLSPLAGNSTTGPHHASQASVGSRQPPPPVSQTPTKDHLGPAREESPAQTLKKWAENIFSGRLEARDDGTGKLELVNTTGDQLNPQGLLVKSQTIVGEGKDGQQYLMVGVDQEGHRQWLAKSEFRESPGPNGVYYLPEYTSSPSGAAISGGMRGAISLAPLGPVGMAVGAGVGAASGLLAQKVPTDSSAVKALAGAGFASACLAAAGLVLGGPPAALGLAVVGAFLGATGALGGEGEGKVRDANYAGTVLGAFAPQAALALPVAAALGAKAEKPLVQALVSAGWSAALTGAQVAITGGHPAAIGIAAILGAVAPTAGRITMNVIRNGTQELKAFLKKPLTRVIEKLPNPVLRALTGLPAAFLAGSLGMVAGPAVAVGVGLAAGVGSVAYSTFKDKRAPKNPGPQAPSAQG